MDGPIVQVPSVGSGRKKLSESRNGKQSGGSVKMAKMAVVRLHTLGIYLLFLKHVRRE